MDRAQRSADQIWMYTAVKYRGARIITINPFNRENTLVVIMRFVDNTVSVYTYTWRRSTDGFICTSAMRGAGGVITTRHKTQPELERHLSRAASIKIRL